MGRDAGLSGLFQEAAIVARPAAWARGSHKSDAFSLQILSKYLDQGNNP
jgi:hypothetical protein